MNTKNQKSRYPVANVIYLLLCFCGLMCISSYSKAQKSKWNAPAEANNLKNPLTGDAAAVKEGKVLYTSYCTPCHGDKGKGDGVAAASLSTKPADHSSDYVQTQTDGALFWMITEGHNPMPTYKQAFSETQRWQLVNYIRTLAKNPKK